MPNAGRGGGFVQVGGLGDSRSPASLPASQRYCRGPSGLRPAVLARRPSGLGTAGKVALTEEQGLRMGAGNEDCPRPAGGRRVPGRSQRGGTGGAVLKHLCWKGRGRMTVTKRRRWTAPTSLWAEMTTERGPSSVWPLTPTGSVTRALSRAYSHPEGKVAPPAPSSRNRWGPREVAKRDSAQRATGPSRPHPPPTEGPTGLGSNSWGIERAGRQRGLPLPGGPRTRCLRPEPRGRGQVLNQQSV